MKWYEGGEQMANDMEKLLKEAFDEIAKEDYANRPTDLPEHRFSLRFRLKMHRMMKEAARGRGTVEPILNQGRSFCVRKRVAVAALLVFVIAGGTAFGAEPIIQWLSKFSVEQEGDHFKIQNKELDENVEHTKDNFRKYFLTEIPEGYSLKSEEFEEGFQRYMISYSKGKDMLILKQTWQEEKFQERLTLDEDLKNIEVNGFTGYYSEDEGIGSLVLSNGVYKLVLGGTFAKDELIEMAGKLKLSDNTVE